MLVDTALEKPKQSLLTPYKRAPGTHTNWRAVGAQELQDFVLGPYVWDGARRAVRCLKDWYAAEEEIGEGQEVRVENSYKLRLDGFVHFVHRAKQCRWVPPGQCC